jgi:hypothetical protein
VGPDFASGATSITTAPTRGDATETDKATSYNSSGAEVFTPQSEVTYDQYGRVLTTLDAHGSRDGQRCPSARRCPEWR